MEKWKKNDLVETMQTVGLDPLQFELEESDDGKVRIKHKYSPSWFTFRYDGGSITGSYVVGDGPEWGSVPSSTWHGGLLPRITTWLSTASYGRARTTTYSLSAAQSRRPFVTCPWGF
jgi:hypothetical protein